MRENAIAFLLDILMQKMFLVIKVVEEDQHVRSHSVAREPKTQRIIWREVVCKKKKQTNVWMLHESIKKKACTWSYFHVEDLTETQWNQNSWSWMMKNE